MNIIGRTKEKDKLELMLRSDIPEFVAVYGRRRVGKTFLIREYFNNKFAFYVSGSTEAKTNRQKISIFHKALKEYGCDEKNMPVDWIEAFDRLKGILESENVYREPINGRRVVFIDEMPWMDTGRNDFRLALDLFWNTWASSQKDICLIVCGSATSWIINNMIKDRGGFHNRLTRQIHLQPFNLAETEQFMEAKGFELPRKQIIKTYMVFGGIPYYLNLLDNRLSLDQNIQALIFDKQGELHTEYELLFNALFGRSDNHKHVVEALSDARRGMTRAEMSKLTNINNGGSLSVVLTELEECGFIREFTAFNKGDYGKMYQLTDPFVIFYITFIKGKKVSDWMKFIERPAYYAWAGLAFETVCINHIEQIKKALGISGISTEEYSWQGKAAAGRKGAQIDLLIDRADSMINICEMKYTESPFTIDEEYKDKLINKRDLFRETVKTSKAVTLVMISAAGVKRNGYYDILQHSIDADALFD